MVNRVLFFSYIFTLVLTVFFVPVCVSEAWTAPTSTPLGGNTDAPLNTGSTFIHQVKNGDLSVNVFAAFMNSYFAAKLGVGTAFVLATLDVNPTVTTSEDLKNIKSGLVYNGVLDVLNYFATYIAAPLGTGVITNKYALVTESGAGKVGFGTITPAAALSVAGGIQVGDDVATCVIGKAGTVRWHAGVMEVCTGAVWSSISSAGACPSNGGCPVGSSGATCLTYSVASVNKPALCPTPRTSVCSDSSWSPTPYAYAVCNQADIFGCTNQYSSNYMSSATVDDGSCNPVYGCTLSGACNNNSNANIDDGSCYFPGDPCQSGANNCGATNGGTYNGCSCDATTPDDEEFCPQ